MINLENERVRIGIDLGGTKIEIIAISSSGEVLHQKRVSTPVGDYEETISVITDLVFSFERDYQCQALVGVGMPGAISSLTGKVKNSNSVCLNGKPFKEDLITSLNRAVEIENDANCFALSEAVDGAAKGENVVFGVILGTGVGGGIVVNQKIMSGPNAICGEWGHNPLPWIDEEETAKIVKCYCGKEGCIETWLCGKGLSNNYFSLCNQKCSAIEISEKAESGDEFAQKALLEYCRQLAKALASVINIIDPNVIVLGGGLSNIKQIYTRVPEFWCEYVFSDRVDTKLVPAKFGDASGVRGAAWLGDD